MLEEFLAIHDFIISLMNTTAIVCFITAVALRNLIIYLVGWAIDRDMEPRHTLIALTEMYRIEDNGIETRRH